RRPPLSARFPYPTLFRPRRDLGGAEQRLAGAAGGLHEVLQRLPLRSAGQRGQQQAAGGGAGEHGSLAQEGAAMHGKTLPTGGRGDRKSTRLNSSHVKRSY